MDKGRILVYYAEWLIPFCTGPYIILTEWYDINWFVAYVSASMIAATLYYPVNKWIFKRDPTHH